MASVAEKPNRPLWWIQREIAWRLVGTGFAFDRFGADSVGVQGDARVIGPTVILIPSEGRTTEDAGRVCTDLINKVPGITRALIDVSPTM